MPCRRSRAAAEAPTLLDALARVPAAAALVVAALDELEDRKAQRLVNSHLRDAIDEATTKLAADCEDPGPVRLPTPRRLPRIEELTVTRPDSAVLKALGAETCGRLRTLHLGDPWWPVALDVLAARALAVALRRMPALRALELRDAQLPDEAAQELFRASRAGAAP